MVRIKSKTEQTRERSRALSYLHFSVVAIEKGPLVSPLTMVANNLYNILNIFIYQYII